MYITTGENYLLGKYGKYSGKIHKIKDSKKYEDKVVEFYINFILGKTKKEVSKYGLKYEKEKKTEGKGSYYEYGNERPYKLQSYNCIVVGLSSIYYANGYSSIDEYKKTRTAVQRTQESHTYFNPKSAVRTPILNGKTFVIAEYKGAKLGDYGYDSNRVNEINKIIEKLQRDSGVKKW